MSSLYLSFLYIPQFEIKKRLRHFPSPGTHQSGFIGRLHLLPLNLVPVYVLEEGMHRDLTVGTEGDAKTPRGVLVEQLKGKGYLSVFAGFYKGRRERKGERTHHQRNSGMRLKVGRQERVKQLVTGGSTRDAGQQSSVYEGRGRRSIREEEGES